MRTAHQLVSLLCFGSLLSPATSTAQTPSATSSTTASNITVAASIGQQITLDNTTFKVTAKKPLASGVEFYTVKPTTSTKATAVNYVRTPYGYARTMFSQAQYESFYKSGKMSAFGTLKEEVYDDGTKVSYIANSTTIGYFFPDGKQLVLVEVETPMAAVSGGSGSSEPSESSLMCRRDCLYARQSCNNDANAQSNPDVKAGMLKGCAAGFGYCAALCYFANGGRSAAIQLTCTLPVKAL